MPDEPPASDVADPPATAVSEATTTPTVVDFPRTLRRMRRSLAVIAALVVLGWGLAGAVGDGWSLRLLAELSGLGLAAAFVAEVVVVGGSAVKGLLAAGERGDRLAGSDVSLLPPQVGRRRRR